MTAEAKEELREFLSSSAYPHVAALLAALAADQELLVLQLSLDGVLDDRTLIHRKLRAEGAKKLLSDFNRQLQSLRSKHKA